MLAGILVEARAACEAMAATKAKGLTLPLYIYTYSYIRAFSNLNIPLF